MKTQAAIQSFLYSRRSLNLRPTSIRWYQKNLDRFASFCSELPMEPEPIEEFLVKVVSDEKDETRHAHYRTLRALYHFICKRHRLPNPIDFVDAPRRRKKVRPTLTSQEMMQLLYQAQSLRDRAILSLFIDSGARCGEAASLRKQDIFEDQIKVDGKTGQREIPISDETRRLLLALVADDGNTEFVFRGQRGEPLTTSGIYQLVKRHMRKAGITGSKLGPHRIRHGFGKLWIKNGGDTRSLQEIMGHASISTTEIYVTLSRDEIVAKHHQFTPLRSAHAAAQESFFDKTKVLAEAEAILESSSQ